MGLRVVFGSPNGHGRPSGNGASHAGNGNGHAPRNGYELDQAPFVRHLRMHVGRQVEIATVCGRVTGRVLEVESDHAVVQVDGRRLHIPYRQMCWFGNGSE